MNAEILTRYIHFIGLFGIVSALVSEHLLLKPVMTRRELKRLFVLDSIYGISAITAIAAGFILWFGVGKAAEFYSKNWIFHLKVTLAIVLGLLSIYPTIFFFKNRKGEDLDTTIKVPKAIKMLMRLQLLIIFLLPLLAALMAKGVGFYG